MQISYPFENANTTEAQYSQLFRRLQFTGVSEGLLPFGDSSGLTVKVPAGFGLVRGHAYQNTATESLAIAAADPSNPRIDLVVLKLDPGANSVILSIKTGTPAASPSAPALVETDESVFEFALASVLVPAGSTNISAGQVTDLRRFTGSQFGRWTTATRPVSPATGQAGFNTTIQAPEYFNGSAWVAFLSNITAAMISSTEQSNIVAGKIRSGGNPAGAATTIYVQATQPAAAAAGDLWFW